MSIEADPVLGKALANYPSERTRPLIISVVICAVASVVLNFTLATVPEWWGPALTTLIMGALVLGCGWYLLHIWNREVILFEHGFSYREGSNNVYFLYSEVKSVHQRAERLRYFGGLIRRAVYRTTIRTTRDEVITLNNIYRRIADLSIRLETQFNVVHRPVVEHRLHQGEKVAFGSQIALTTQGVVVGERTLLWTDFAGFRVQNGNLLLLTHSDPEWTSVPLAEIDNLLLLLDLMRTAQQAKAL